MEQREAPREYAFKTMTAFDRSSWLPIVVGIGLCMAISAVWRGAPFWLFGIIMAGSFMTSAVLFEWMKPKFRCPQCGREIDTGLPEKLDKSGPVSLVCWDCRIEWNMGYSEGCD